MSEQKTDRRIRRTRRELENALIRLLTEKNIQSISVKELCEEADVTRSTFYQHYSNPYDMLTEIQDRIMDQVQEIINTTTGGDSYGFFLHIFTLLAEDDVKPEILSFDNGNGSGYERIGYMINNNYLLRWGQTFTSAQKKQYDYYRCYIVFGCIAMVENWVNNGKQESPEEMAHITFSVLPKERMYLKA